MAPLAWRASPRWPSRHESPEPDRFVQDVADGYPYRDEYTDELDRRDVLEDALSMLSRTGRRTSSDRVDPVDDRFEQVTKPTERGFRSQRWEVRRWWWHRIPLVLVGDLAGRFQSGLR